MLIQLIRIVSYYVLPVGLLGLSLIVKDVEFFSKLGQLTLALLTVILYVKPLVVLTKNKWLARLLTLRREMGVASFWLFFFHMNGLIYLKNLQIEYFLNWRRALFWGAAAGIGMFLLGITSNNYAQRLLKRNWKKLQSISYVVYLMALYHTSLVERGLGKFYILGGGFILLKLWERIKTRKVNREVPQI